MKNLLLDTIDGVATLTIHRPAALNALDPETLSELDAAVGGLAGDPAVRAVVLTGSGEKAFVAGADISVMQGMNPAGALELARLGHRICRRIERAPKVFIAAVNGYALGGGCELALACDLRFAAENARFGQPEINLGIIPGFGGTQRLPRLVGRGRALELLLTGEMVDAHEAHRIGLVNRVLPPGEMLGAAQATARQVAGKGLAAVRLCKEAVDNGLEMDLARAADYEAELFALCFATADQKEGMQAFLEKRRPAFRDC